MILNYLKLAFRNAIRQPFYTLVNVVGLTIGMVACWLLATYYFHEKQYDTFLPHANRIAAAALDLKMGDTEGVTTNTPPPLGMRLAEYPEVEMTARTFGLGDVLMRQSESSTNTVFSESNAFAVDSTFLSLFEFPMVQGDKNALNAPLSLVLTEKMAQKYFGTTQAVGKSLSLNDRLFRVTGVIKDLPTNASLNFGFLVPVKDFRVVENFSWPAAGTHDHHQGAGAQPEAGAAGRHVCRRAPGDGAAAGRDRGSRGGGARTPGRHRRLGHQGRQGHAPPRDPRGALARFRRGARGRGCG